YDKALQYDSANPAAKNKLALVRDLVGGSGKSGTIVAAASPPAAPASKEPAKAPTAGSARQGTAQGANRCPPPWSGPSPRLRRKNLPRLPSPRLSPNRPNRRL